MNERAYSSVLPHQQHVGVARARANHGILRQSGAVQNGCEFLGPS